MRFWLCKGKFQDLISGYFTLPSFTGFGNKRNSELFVLSHFTQVHSPESCDFTVLGDCISMQQGEKEKAHIVHPVWFFSSWKKLLRDLTPLIHTGSESVSKEAICILCSLKFVLLLGISGFFFPSSKHINRRKLYILSASSSP